MAPYGSGYRNCMNRGDCGMMRNAEVVRVLVRWVSMGEGVGPGVEVDSRGAAAWATGCSESRTLSAPAPGATPLSSTFSRFVLERRPTGSQTFAGAHMR